MLWEPIDPDDALRERFGFVDMAAMTRWLSSALTRHWGLPVIAVPRVVISADNALAWVETTAGTFVAKVCADRERFARLDMIGDVVTHLGSTGVPVPVPRPTTSGAARAQVTGSTRSLSVILQPAVAGDLLDVTDLEAVAAAGKVLARLHTAGAAMVPALRSAGFHAGATDLHVRLHRVAHRLHRTPALERIPQPLRTLDRLLAGLPAIKGPATLVHNDFRSTNILTLHSQVTAVLDFDEMAIDYPVVDLARAATLLNTRFTTWDPAPAAAHAAFVAGYRSARGLSDAETAWLAAMMLALGLLQVPDGRNPEGWAESVEMLAARA